MSELKKKYLHTTIIPIRWGDMDALGHINNTEYFRYMEQTRVEWLEEMGYTVDLTQKEGIVVVTANCTFKVPLVYPGSVEVQMYIENVGRSSFSTTYELRLRGNDLMYAEGSSTLVWISIATAKSIPLPSNLKMHLESRLSQGKF